MKGDLVPQQVNINRPSTRLPVEIKVHPSLFMTSANSQQTFSEAVGSAFVVFDQCTLSQRTSRHVCPCFPLRMQRLALQKVQKVLASQETFIKFLILRKSFIAIYLLEPFLLNILDATYLLIRKGIYLRGSLPLESTGAERHFLGWRETHPRRGHMQNSVVSLWKPAHSCHLVQAVICSLLNKKPCSFFLGHVIYCTFVEGNFQNGVLRIYQIFI